MNDKLEKLLENIRKTNFSDTGLFTFELSAEKPLRLIKYLVETYSKKGDLILDPFLGSGTTTRACKDLNRNYIGIEISEDYVKIAQDRLKQEVLL